MEHVVFYTAGDGSPAYRRTANLDDAVRVVEHLRNAEAIEDVHVYSLASVALNFRPYYRVEINANAVEDAAPNAFAPQAVAEPAPAAPAAALPQQSAPAPAAPPAPPSPFSPIEPAGLHQQVDAQPMPAMTMPQAQPEPAAAMAAAPADGAGDEGDANANGRGRSLGFFTR